MKETSFKVLKTMSEATSRMDLNMFAKKVDLTPNQTIQQFQELAKEGFLNRVGNGFAIADKGKWALKAFTPVSEEHAFRFYFGIDQPAELSAKTLEEFFQIVKQVGVGSLEFHLNRGDFENWLTDVWNEPHLADEIGRSNHPASRARRSGLNF